MVRAVRLRVGAGRRGICPISYIIYILGEMRACPRERRRITQLVVCLALFLAVFIGKGIFPERIADLR